MTPVFVEWVDSITDGGWFPREDAINRSGTPDVLATRSIGFLVDERADYVLLATSFMREGDLVQGVLQIPRAAIKAMRDVPDTEAR